MHGGGSVPKLLKLLNETVYLAQVIQLIDVLARTHKRHRIAYEEFKLTVCRAAAN